jgi:hypothetical protein
MQLDSEESGEEEEEEGERKAGNDKMINECFKISTNQHSFLLVTFYKSSCSRGHVIKQ